MLLPIAAYARATRCPVLTQRMLLPGSFASNPDTQIPYAELLGSTLRPPYAMSGTNIAYGAVCLRPPYAMSGIDIAYGLRPR
eukprot:1285803-Rhodomonas_salina.2